MSILLAASCSQGRVEDGDFRFKNAPEVVEVRPKKPVKIELRRMAEGKYSYEITGDDPEEIIKADSRLRQYLKTDASPR